jgi:hypothetical protein
VIGRLAALVVAGVAVAGWLNEKGRRYEMEAAIEDLNAQVRAQVVPALHETGDVLGRAVDLLNELGEQPVPDFLQGEPMPEEKTTTTTETTTETEQPQPQPQPEGQPSGDGPEGGNDPGGAV